MREENEILMFDQAGSIVQTEDKYFLYRQRDRDIVLCPRPQRPLSIAGCNFDRTYVRLDTGADPQLEVRCQSSRGIPSGRPYRVLSCVLWQRVVLARAASFSCTLANKYIHVTTFNYKNRNFILIMNLQSRIYLQFLNSRKLFFPVLAASMI